MFAVVVPMFDEEAGARRCVDHILPVLATMPGSILVVVDDGSRDRTLEILRDLRNGGAPFELVEGGTNRGYGGALRLGAQRAAALGATWALFIDSDLTNPPSQIPEFAAAAGDDVDFVKACRYCRDGSTGDVPMFRVVVSRVGNLVARVLTGLPHADLTNGFRAVRLDRYLVLDLHERGFGAIMEEMYWAKRLGWRGAALPSVLHDRAADLRPTSFRYTWRQVWQYLRWPLRTVGWRVTALFERG